MEGRRDIFVTPAGINNPLITPRTPGFVSQSSHFQSSSGNMSSAYTPAQSSSDLLRSSTIDHTPLSHSMLTRKRPPALLRGSGGPSSEIFRTPGGKRVQTTRGSSGGTGGYSVPSSAAQSSIGVQRTSVIAAISENRAREIGLCLLDLKNPEVVLMNFVDSHHYVSTLSSFSVYDVREVLLPATSCSPLQKYIEAKFPMLKITVISRKYFSEAKGEAWLSGVCLKECSGIVEECSSHYLSMASVSALFQFIEYQKNITFATETLRVSYRSCDGTLLLDSATLASLEVLVNARTGHTKISLFGVLNQTKTQMGARLLRSNLCQPPSDMTTINARLDVVEELLASEELYLHSREILSKFAICDLESVISHFVMIPKDASNFTLEQNIRDIVILKEILSLTPSLREILSKCKCKLISTISTNFPFNECKIFQEKISSKISDDIFFSKSKRQMLLQLCFAVRAGVDGLLDVARKTYSESIEDIHKIVDILRETFNWGQNLKLQFNHRRGYFLSLAAKSGPPPREISVQEMKKSGKVYLFSTEQLISVNERAKESLKEVFLLTNKVLAGLKQFIRERVNILYKLSGIVSLFDMLCAFASYSVSTDGCVRPVITTNGSLIAIQNARHPILCFGNLYENSQRNSSSIRDTNDPNDQISGFVPVHIFATETANLQIITGPNMSGKSTYLLTAGLCVIMAHLGCFLPAAYASVRLCDKLMTRIGTSDSIEDNSSSMMAEMKSMAYILQNATSRSLVLIDELCRSTEVHDGIGLCWSICEYLLELKATTLFSTHMHELCGLDQYPTVKLLTMKTEVKQDGGVVPFFEIKEGAPTNTSYGINVALMAGLPSSLITESMAIRTRIAQSNPQKSMTNRDLSSEKTKAMFQLGQRLMALTNSSLDDEAFRKYLIQLKERYALEGQESSNGSQEES